MKWTDDSISQAQRDVWAWKAAIYEEVRDLPVAEALSAILDKADALRASAKSRRARRVTKSAKKPVPQAREVGTRNQ